MSEEVKELLTAEKKQADAEKRATAVLEDPEQESAKGKLFHPAPIKLGLTAPPNPPPFNKGSRNTTITFFQKAYGNLSTLRYFNYPIQAKLTVGCPNDIYEQEADRVADEIMRMSEKETVNDDHSTIRNPPSAILQRKPT